jgi:hypothetical protein
MPKETVLIKGGKVKSVWVGPVWTEITIAIPTETVVRLGGKMNPQRPKSTSRAAKKAVETKRRKKEAALALAGGAGN